MTGTRQALALGIGSLFNHHDTRPNVGWWMDRTEGFIDYRATRDVASDEELTINYGDVSWMPGHETRKETETETEQEDAAAQEALALLNVEY